MIRKTFAGKPLGPRRYLCRSFAARRSFRRKHRRAFHKPAARKAKKAQPCAASSRIFSCPLGESSANNNFRESSLASGYNRRRENRYSEVLPLALGIAPDEDIGPATWIETACRLSSRERLHNS